MPITELHELHHRRFGRNLGLGTVLAAVVVIIFALTMVKVTLEGSARDATAPGTSAAAASGTAQP